MGADRPAAGAARGSRAPRSEHGAQPASRPTWSASPRRPAGGGDLFVSGGSSAAGRCRSPRLAGRRWPGSRSTCSPGGGACTATGSCWSASASPRTNAGLSYVLTKGRIFEVEPGLRVARWLAQRPRLGPGLAAGGRPRGARAADARARPPRRRARARRGPRARARVSARAPAVVAAGVCRPAHRPGRRRSGPIGFVAFVAPHLAPPRPLGSAQGPLLLAAGCGALLVLVSDLSGRLLFSPTGIPVESSPR